MRGTGKSEAQLSLAWSQARRRQVRASHQRARRLRLVFVPLALIGAVLVIAQVTADRPVPYLAAIGVLLLMPLASVRG